VGVGFAIPINTARIIMADLIEHGEVRRGFLGIQMRAISAEMTDQLGIRGLRGAQVVQVVPNSPAANAGVRSGDIIVAVDDDAVDAPGDLRNHVAMLSPGDRVELRLIRNGQRTIIAAELGRQP
jgi:serine protease Do